MTLSIPVSPIGLSQRLAKLREDLRPTAVRRGRVAHLVEDKRACEDCDGGFYEAMVLVCDESCRRAQDRDFPYSIPGKKLSDFMVDGEESLSRGHR